MWQEICAVLLAGFVLTGCANITVTKVDDSRSAKGIRYSLPKPILQAAPQADGTVAVDFFYLPDSDNTYAISTSSTGSSYTYQVTVTQNGLLGAVEFKEETSVVGQQLAATAGAATAQILNIQNSQLVAAQTAVNTAQASFDTAKATVDAAAAQLHSDTANGVTANLPTDQAALAAAQAKLQDAQAVLDRAKNTAQAVTITASAGTPVASSNPSPSATGFGAQQWTAPMLYDLPSSRGAVLYAVNDFIDPTCKDEVKLKCETVSLVAQEFPAQGTGAGTIPEAKQQFFETTALALGPPTLGPQSLTYSLASGSITFIFSREIQSLDGSNIVASDGTLTSAHKAVLSNDKKSLVQDLTGLKAGSYVFNALYTDDIGKPRTAAVKFTLS